MCRWSYGGNRLQIKAEYFLLGDLQAALEKVAHIGRDTMGSRKSLQSKQDLLAILLASEQTRLIVWLYPLDSDKRTAQHAVNYPKLPTDVSVLDGWNILLMASSVSSQHGAQNSMERESCHSGPASASISIAHAVRRSTILFAEFPGEDPWQL
jgi:hypothetical protein